MLSNMKAEGRSAEETHAALAQYFLLQTRRRLR
jgi:hypothetical protein